MPWVACNRGKIAYMPRFGGNRDPILWIQIKKYLKITNLKIFGDMMPQLCLNQDRKSFKPWLFAQSSHKICWNCKNATVSEYLMFFFNWGIKGVVKAQICISVLDWTFLNYNILILKIKSKID